VSPSGISILLDNEFFNFFFVIIGGYNWTGSSINMQNRNVAEEVIPELDENLTTIVSMKKEKKPTVQDIFGPEVSNAPPPSQPIDVPKPTDFRPQRPVLLFSKSVVEPRKVVNPTSIYASVPSVAKPKFELFPVDSPDAPKDEKETETVTEVSIEQAGPSGERHQIDSIGTEQASTVMEEEEEYEEEDIQTGKKRSSSTDNLAKKLAKTFGLKPPSGDEKAEVHLLSDISDARDDESFS
jgi:hypothetical protein